MREQYSTCGRAACDIGLQEVLEQLDQGKKCTSDQNDLSQRSLLFSELSNASMRDRIKPSLSRFVDNNENRFSDLNPIFFPLFRRDRD